MLAPCPPSRIHPSSHRRLARPAPPPLRAPEPPPKDPAWARPGLFAVLALAAILVGWGLTRSGMSNTYYAAAVKSATVSWKAWFFGALDPGSFITVDKPPLAIWLMGLSGRVFGFSSFSMLLPEAICAVAAVGVLHATVKRLAGPGPALLAAGALAISPVSIAIGRVNNPDALLVFLLVLSAYLVVRAVQSGRTATLAWAGAVVGLAFMTKMLQGWMVVPALGAVYLLAGPPRLAVRIRQLLVAGVTMTVVSAAWPLAVTLWPGSAPYIGGSTDGSAWNLIFGYNGFGRLFGENGGGGGALVRRRARAGCGCSTRRSAAQIAWLLPLAAVGLAAGPVAHAPRAPDRRPPRAAGALRRLGARALRDLQPPGGHVPPVLRQRARPGGRRARRSRPAHDARLGAPLLGRGRGTRGRGRGLGLGGRRRCSPAPRTSRRGCGR